MIISFSPNMRDFKDTIDQQLAKGDYLYGNQYLFDFAAIHGQKESLKIIHDWAQKHIPGKRYFSPGIIGELLFMGAHDVCEYIIKEIFDGDILGNPYLNISCSSMVYIKKINKDLGNLIYDKLWKKYAYSCEIANF
jgi:hypothetical protein